MDVNELEVVRDGIGMLHLLMHDDDELGLTLCGDGHGFEMDSVEAQYKGESIRLDLAVTCVDCLIGAGGLGKIRKAAYRG